MTAADHGTGWTVATGGRTYYRPNLLCAMFRWSDANPAYWWWASCFGEPPRRAVVDDFGNLRPLDETGVA